MLVSFGSILDPKLMGARMRHALLTAFVAFPDHEFVVKLASSDNDGGNANETEFFRRHPNIHLFEWIEQKAMLGEWV